MAQTNPPIGSSPLANLGGVPGRPMQQLGGPPPGAAPPPGMQQDLMQQMASGWNAARQPMQAMPRPRMQQAAGTLRGMQPQPPPGAPGLGAGGAKGAAQGMPAQMKQQIAGLPGAPR